MMATVLHTDGTRDVLTPGPRGFSLDQLQLLVGGSIDIVWLAHEPQLHRSRVLIVNDDGHRLALPINHAATRLYQGTPARHDWLVLGEAIEAFVYHAGEDNERIV